MKIFSKFLLAVIALIIASTLSARADYDFKEGNLYYKIVSIDERTCAVCEHPVPGENYEGRVVIPQTVTYNNASFTVVTIEELAFWRSPITSVELPNTLKVIKSSAFSTCENLKSVKFPEGLKEIGPSAFYGCSNLTTINIPKSIISIYQHAFDWCRKLQGTIVIPPSCKEIGEYAFGVDINSNFNIVIEDGNKPLWLYAHCFFGGKSIYIGREITGEARRGYTSANRENGMHHFSGLYMFKEITIGDNVSELPRDNGYLGEREIDILRIGYNLHKLPELNADIMKAVYVNNPDPSSFTFDFTNKTYISATLFVPRGSKSSYQNSTTWKKFLNIQEYDAQLSPSVQARIKEEQERRDRALREQKRFAEQERKKREEQAKREKEKKNWDIACRVNTIESYQKYIADGGEDVNSAYSKIDSLYWNQACKTDEIGDYREYLARNTKAPKEYVYYAQKRIEVIERQNAIIAEAETIKDKQKAFWKVQEARRLGKIQYSILKRALVVEEPYAYKKAKSKDATLSDVEWYLSTYSSVAPNKHISEIKEKQKKIKAKISSSYTTSSLSSTYRAPQYKGYRKMGDVSINTAVNIQTICI